MAIEEVKVEEKIKHNQRRSVISNFEKLLIRNGNVFFLWPHEILAPGSFGTESWLAEWKEIVGPKRDF